ncbi:BTB/POZ domain-containing protein FBL11 [Acorus calamus]|uniref:BTB/POZ domain-containing protein FBL11 n=1 Tax=Acorus calamus TaxID=4465 RepID=A0AAV9DEX4_ACOCL|nr:BTB/POZ domain-containing protein FBL11 [Acorus calamus]
MQKCPLIDEVDFTVDISPVLQTKVSVISVSTERCKASGIVLHSAVKERSMLSSITKLTLEGRTDIDDVDLSVLAALSDTLSYINLNGCSSVTDLAISNLISKCMNLQSIIVSDTSFGRYSILALCSDGQYGKEVPEMYGDHKPSSKMTFGLQKLHIDGCKGVDHASMHLLMSTVNMLKSLSLRGTLITDDALCAFLGSSLERLDVSETMISVMALACIIRRNTGLRIIRARDCKALHCIDASEGHDESDTVASVLS